MPIRATIYRPAMAMQQRPKLVWVRLVRSTQVSPHPVRRTDSKGLSALEKVRFRKRNLQNHLQPCQFFAILDVKSFVLL